MLRVVPTMLTALALVSCAEVGCLTGNDDRCTVPSACEALSFECSGGNVQVRVLESLDGLPLSNQSLAAPGDILMSNDKIWVVIDALDHPHLLSDTGGTIIDMGTWDGGEDVMQQVFVVSGLLPTEVAHYTELRLIDDGDVVAVHLRGTLAGSDDLKVATRYELRSCEPGIRVRSELVNRSSEPQSWMLLDAFWWGGRGLLSFAPQTDGGFTWPEWGLLNIADGFRKAPYLASGMHDGASSSYAEVACDRPQMDALHSEYVSGGGLGPRVVQPRDYLTYERFIAVGKGPSVSAATDPVFEVRRQLFDEAYITLSGSLSTQGAPVSGRPLAASIEVFADGVPVTQLVPDERGQFSARVPADTALSLRITSFGVVASQVDIAGSTTDLSLDAIELPPVGALSVSAQLDGHNEELLVFVLPADDATAAAVSSDVYGHWGTCAPLLGLPHGRSPACNRVLVNGEQTLPILPGRYDLFASAGPFSSLAAARGVEVVAGSTAQVTLDVVRLALQPPGTLSGDFHVHGGASWDASMDDIDRVRAFLAADIDVIVSTEHNTAYNYADAIEQLSADERLQLITGTENTGVLLFGVIPDTLIPKVTGHWNFWPVTYDPNGPWRGSWWDQGALPGELMNRASLAGWPAATGVAQLNHPTNELLVGREFGWADTIGLDLNRDVEDSYDGTPHSLFADQPAGSPFRNSDFHATEVMNGTSNEVFEGYRAIWWWMLNQGVLRSGTANSDSHTLTENIVGTPRTLVWTDQVVGPTFDVARFNESVRDGRMVGTNGPVIEATVWSDQEPFRPSLTARVPSADAELHLVVTAAPWVPVTEVRIVVNGQTVQTLTDLAAPSDPLSTDPADLLRLDTTLDLASLLPAAGDAWLSIEAGVALPLSADLNCDGIPDTGDTNRDGVVDWRDVDGLEDGEAACLETVGPRPTLPTPERDTALWWFQAAVPRGYPASFTNPFVFDLDGDGFEGVMR